MLINDKMVSTALTSREKEACPGIPLKTRAKELNEFVKNTHKQIKKKIVLERNTKKKIKSDFKKGFEKLTKLDKKKKMIRNHNAKVLATTKDLSRILGLLDIEKKLGLNDITLTCRLKSEVCKNALKFLVQHNFVKEGEGVKGALTFEKNE